MLLAFAGAYSALAFSSTNAWHVTSFYFGRSVVAMLISIVVFMAINVALTAVLNRKQKGFLVDIIINSAVLLIVLILTIAVGTKFTQKSNPTLLTTGISACLLVAAILSLGLSIYTIVYVMKHSKDILNEPDFSKPIEALKAKQAKNKDKKEPKPEDTNTNKKDRVISIN